MPHSDGSEIISNPYVIVVQVRTLWHQRKCDTSYASWTRGEEDFMQCVWDSMGKGRHQFMTTYVRYLCFSVFVSIDYSFVFNHFLSCLVDLRSYHYDNFACS
jgi:hypothetical protein